MVGNRGFLFWFINSQKKFYENNFFYFHYKTRIVIFGYFMYHTDFILRYVIEVKFPIYGQQFPYGECKT